jgi:hypothetical protein
MPRPASSTVALSDLVGWFEVSAVVKSSEATAAAGNGGGLVES